MITAELHALASKVAAAISTRTGQDWRYDVPTDDPPYWVGIALGASEDAPGIRLQHSDREKKLTVTGVFPRGDRGDYGPYRDRQSIGISASKPVDAIARDIARRFLPDYLPAHAKALEAKRRDVADYGKGLAVAQALAALIGDDLRETEHTWTLLRSGTPYIRAEVTPHSNDRRVKLIVSDLTQAEAEAILAVLPKEKAQEDVQ